jgi:hypothetical protein
MAWLLMKLKCIILVKIWMSKLGIKSWEISLIAAIKCLVVGDEQFCVKPVGIFLTDDPWWWTVGSVDLDVVTAAHIGPCW